ncbi:MAG: beta-L-arabinofuranosidase domain-containing protein [Anaerolineae bacterium]|jgi:DUF1680 family protein|nr:beta-L-arabinofuranosidase domain-containing protein [Anaerolineae bacterium]
MTHKKHAVFHPVSLSSIEPEGWLHRFLLNQRNGLTGHLEAAGYPFNTEGWAMDPVPRRPDGGFWLNWWPYEQTGYWYDGMIRCGHLLKDSFLIDKAMKTVDFVLGNQDEDGYLGPKFLKSNDDSRNRWAHAVYFRTLMAHHSATGDERIIKAMEAHYTSDTNDHSKNRDVCNIEEILWTYEHTGNSKLLEHALEAYHKFNEREDTRDAGDNKERIKILGIPLKVKFPGADRKSDVSMKGMLRDEPGHEHGVTYNEICKQAAILYLYTGEEKYWEAVKTAYEKLDKYHMLVDGVHSSTEHLRAVTPLESHETCDIADYTWSLGYLLEASGDALYADKIERACFNALPGAVRADFTGTQYFSCPNQIVADKSSNHNKYFHGSQWMSYRPNPGTECCAGNVHRVMPNYAARMWYADGSTGIVAALYGPSRITRKLGADQQEVTIVENTDYPFSEQIDFEIRCEKSVKFAFTLRIPAWTNNPRLLLNGKPLEIDLLPGTFTTIERNFAPYDILTLHLPMTIKTRRWSKGGISIERGPLVYALKIKEDWQIDHDEKLSTREFPAWNLYPVSDWNYALAIDENDPTKDIQMVFHSVKPNPWKLEDAPIELIVPARKVEGWKMVETDEIERTPGKGLFGIPRWNKASIVKGDFKMTPDLPEPETLQAHLSDAVEMVHLVPYGCTRLRISLFPYAGNET